MKGSTLFCVCVHYKLLYIWQHCCFLIQCPYSIKIWAPVERNLSLVTYLRWSCDAHNLWLSESFQNVTFLNLCLQTKLAFIIIIFLKCLTNCIHKIYCFSMCLVHCGTDIKNTLQCKTYLAMLESSLHLLKCWPELFSLIF